MGLCSCLASCLAWVIQHWSLLVIGWSWVLALRWRYLEELLPIDVTWGQEFSCGPMSWTQLFHLGGLGLTPGQSIKTLSATWLEKIFNRGCSENTTQSHLDVFIVSSKPGTSSWAEKVLNPSWSTSDFYNLYPRDKLWKQCRFENQQGSCPQDHLSQICIF